MYKPKYERGGRKMNELQAQLDEVNATIAAETARGAGKDQDILAGLEKMQADILLEMDVAKAKQEQEAAQKVVIQKQEEKRDAYTLPTDFDAFFSDSGYLDAEGKPYVVASANKIILQVVKDALAANDEEHNAKITETESANKTLKQENQALSVQVDDLKAKLNQAIAEKQDAEAKRDAAVNEKKQLEVKESADLADLISQEIAEKEKKAAEDKAKRTVYDVVGDSTIPGIESINYTAKLAATGETITYNWTQRGYYFVLTDPNEIEQFRTQNATQTATEPVAETPVQDTPLVTIPEALHVTEGNIPSQNEVPAVPATVVSGSPSTDGKSGETVTAEQLETRLAQFAVEHGLAKQAVA
jgi:hypothetical protein